MDKSTLSFIVGTTAGICILIIILILIGFLIKRRRSKSSGMNIDI